MKEPREGGGSRDSFTYELPSAIYIYPLHPNTNANFDIFKKNGDLKAQFINEDFKAQFIRLETSWGKLLTYELPIDKNIHPLHPKKPANFDKLI